MKSLRSFLPILVILGLGFVYIIMETGVNIQVNDPSGVLAMLSENATTTPPTR